MSDKNSFLVFSGTNSRYLAEKICASLGCPLGNLVVTKFFGYLDVFQTHSSQSVYLLVDESSLGSHLKPVSYTHLDVYKRQGWRSAPISVEKLLDEMSVGVKGQSNLEIARTPRKAFRCRVGWSP